jgi:biopolymer transport protein TolR
MGASVESTGRSRRTTMSEINVTPLVDVMLVLLIIFMVTAPMMQQGLEVNLPETASGGLAPQEDPLVLQIDRNKQIKIAQAIIPAADLKTKVKAIFEKRTDKTIYVQADKDVAYGVVAETISDIRAAGIFQISLVTIPKQGP